MIGGRPLHLATLDKVRPVVLLTRPGSQMRRVTVAPITSQVKGRLSEVIIGPENGLDRESAISLDNIVTVERADLGRRVGVLSVEQEYALVRALLLTFDLPNP